MKEAGISSVMELATAIPRLATDLGGSKETAAFMWQQKAARKAILDNEFTTTDELERKSLLRCTGSKSLDELLLGVRLKQLQSFTVNLQANHRYATPYVSLPSNR